MKTMKIKEVRELIDSGMIRPEEANGMKVRVGFMELVITGYEETPGDYRPNVWHLERNGVAYDFTPHHGIERA